MYTFKKYINGSNNYSSKLARKPTCTHWKLAVPQLNTQNLQFVLLRWRTIRNTYSWYKNNREKLTGTHKCNTTPFCINKCSFVCHLERGQGESTAVERERPRGCIFVGLLASIVPLPLHSKKEKNVLVLIDQRLRSARTGGRPLIGHATEKLKRKK